MEPPGNLSSGNIDGGRAVLPCSLLKTLGQNSTWRKIHVVGGCWVRFFLAYLVSAPPDKVNHKDSATRKLIPRFRKIDFPRQYCDLSITSTKQSESWLLNKQERQIEIGKFLPAPPRIMRAICRTVKSESAETKSFFLQFAPIGSPTCFT